LLGDFRIVVQTKNMSTVQSPQYQGIEARIDHLEQTGTKMIAAKAGKPVQGFPTAPQRGTPSMQPPQQSRGRDREHH